ncbi:hypothetical protein FACS1894187_16040 [Synergistales bacterium]|nr:hypothetical protein FACS1894187_16040 [Synergistales bacterium]
MFDITVPRKETWDELDDVPTEEVVKKVLREFVKRLKKSEGENLLKVVLFGSMARGDYDEESDTDVFVLLRKGNSHGELGTRISTIAYETDADICRCYTYTAPFIETLEELEERYPKKEYPNGYDFIPIFTSIAEEGVVLYDVEG